jgi:hypothetical protein
MVLRLMGELGQLAGYEFAGIVVHTLLLKGKYRRYDCWLLFWELSMYLTHRN